MLTKRLVSTTIAGALLALGITTSSAAARAAPTPFMDYTDDAFGMTEHEGAAMLSFVVDKDID